ncbi:MAG: bacillithiol biosynthesis BshC [bacterium]|nr:bacillithiol biosynthesis BshC [bacterium]
MTANDSFSSATSPPESPAALGLDLLGGSRLPSLPSAFLSGRDHDLLAPLKFLDAGELPGEPPRVDRTELARALATANVAYGHPAAERLAERLADPATRVVVTGQQPGLYGGPLYALSKMVAAVLWAEAIEASGVPAVAVYWVATEDHDWSETAQATFLARSGPLRVDLGEDPAPLLPVGMRTFGPRLTGVEEQLEGVELPRRWYRPDSRFGEAFCRLLVATMGERAPLMLDSMLPELKTLQRPWLSRLVEHRGDVERAQRQADAAIENRGHPLQVSPQPGLSPLFMLHGLERRRIAWSENGGYSLRGLEGDALPLEQLERILEENPSVISPGVLARPAIQDAVLGTSLQVMGPAELSYLPQVAAIYPVLGIEAPSTTLRPQALVLEERHAGYLEELDVSLAELFDVELDRLVTEKLGEDLVGPVRERIDELLEGLAEPLAALDRGLEGPLRKTRGHIDRGLDQLGGKVAGAVARKHDVWRRRLEQVRTACLPGGKGQERLLSVVHFLDRYGAGFAEVLAAQMGLDPRRLHVVRVSPAPMGGRP